jgi:hypothetical protein
MEPATSACLTAETSVNERRRLAMVTLREAYTTLEHVPDSARSVVQSQIDSILEELAQIGK